MSDVSRALRRLSLELSRACNLRCLYCYASADSRPATEGLGLSDAAAVVDEALALGATRIVIVGGGEPLLHPSMDTGSTQNLVNHIASRGGYVTIFSNCTVVTLDSARWLFDHPVSVIGKLNSLKPEMQDFLAGTGGSAKAMMAGVECLLEAGFAIPDPSRLSLETVICRQNYDELPTMWRWMRDRNIVPSVEIMTVQGRAKANKDILCFPDEEAPDKYRQLFEELLRIDRTEYGYDWIPHPPHVADRCGLYHTNCYVNARGGVQPCVGVDIEYGHLRIGSHKADGKRLAEILASEPFRRCREVEKHIGEPCRSCPLLSVCYGCRGNSWNLTGDIFAGDVTCWHPQRAAVARSCGGSCSSFGRSVPGRHRC